MHTVLRECGRPCARGPQKRRTTAGRVLVELPRADREPEYALAVGVQHPRARGVHRGKTAGQHRTDPRHLFRRRHPARRTGSAARPTSEPPRTRWSTPTGARANRPQRSPASAYAVRVERALQTHHLIDQARVPPPASAPVHRCYVRVAERPQHLREPVLVLRGRVGRKAVPRRRTAPGGGMPPVDPPSGPTNT